MGWFSTAAAKKFETTSAGATVSGSLGIGNTSPIGTLEVYDGTFVLSKPSSNSSSRNWRFLADNAAAGNLGLQVSTAAGGSTFSNVLEVDSSGNIGIGTSTPTSPDGSNADNSNNGKVFTIYGDSPAINLIHNTAGGASAGSTDYAAINLVGMAVQVIRIVLSLVINKLRIFFVLIQKMLLHLIQVGILIRVKRCV